MVGIILIVLDDFDSILPFPDLFISVTHFIYAYYSCLIKNYVFVLFYFILFYFIFVFIFIRIDSIWLDFFYKLCPVLYSMWYTVSGLGIDHLDVEKYTVIV
jgi:hypothetical protein